MKKLFSVLFLLFGMVHTVYSQCYCENCPLPIDPSVIGEANVNISGATNSILGANGQELINIGLHFRHEDIDEMEAVIIAPDGSSVSVLLGNGFGVGPITYYDIDIIPCSQSPLPDCTNSGVLNPNETWDEGPYTGSYHPELGCLEDLTGDINGTWTLRVTDNVFADDGELYCFDLLFADPSGIACNSSECSEVFCSVQGGNMLTPSSVSAPQGDPDLVFDIQVQYNDCEFENVESGYSYVFLIFEGGILQEIQDSPVDMTSYDSGNYVIYGLSIRDSDLAILQAMDFSSVFVSTIFTMITNADICADLSSLFTSVEIEFACDLILGAILEQDDITAPQNDPALDPDWDITFTNPESDPLVYGFYYLVVNADTDLLVAYYNTDDFTLLLEGNYYVTIIYYYIGDQQLLPPPNGVNTFLDVVNLINNGTLCADYFGYNTLTITPSCDANAGTFSPLLIEECVADPALENTITPDFGTSGDPGPDYSYVYIVSQNDVILEISDDADFSDLIAGIYQVCGFSYLTVDAPSIPVPDGGLSVDDIVQLTAAGTVCGDITEDCLILNLAPLPDPSFSGPLTVCAGQLYTYQIENYTGNTDDYILTINMGSFNQFINDPVTGEFFINWSSGPGNICITQIENGCESQDCITIIVEDGETITISGEDEICAGDIQEYVVDPAPIPGQSYTYDVVGGTVVTESNGNVTVDWDDVGPYSLTATLTGGGCGGAETLEVALIDLPAFPVPSLPSMGCTGSGVAISDVSDPDIINWTWTATNADIIIQSGFVNFSWQGPGISEICLEIETQCGTEQNCYFVDIIQSPTPTIDPIITVCNLTFTLDAIPSNGLSWLWISPNSGNTVSYSDQTNYTTEVTVTAPGTYNFILQEFGTFCGSNVETTVIVEDGLATTSPTYDCDDVGNYSISFQILDGVAPFSVDGTPITGDIYTSTFAPSGSSYSFLVIDNEGCETTVSGTFACPCISDAGTMMSDVIGVCLSNNNTITGVHNADEVLDGNDDFTFILHTNAGDFPGVIIAQNNTGTFTFDPSAMITGQVYYVSYVVGDLLGVSVDFSDPCLDVSMGQSIIFYDDPFVDAGADNIVCGNVYNLSQNATPPSNQWTTVGSPSGGNATYSVVNGLTQVSVDITGDYTFQMFYTDINGCDGMDEVTITFLESPEITISDFECTNGEYAISIEMSGGNAPYQVNGDIINGNTLTSSPIASGATYNYIVSDANGCLSAPISGTYLCDCDTEAGTMPLEIIEICAVDGIPINGGIAVGTMLESDDVGIYYLHTNSSNILGTVLQTSPLPEFTYDIGWGSNVTLYISYVAGNDNGSGTPDEADPCLSVSVGQPVQVQSITKVDAGVDTSLCDFTLILKADDRGLPGIWNIISSPPMSAVVIDDSADPESTLSVDTNGIYVLQWVPSGQACLESDTVMIEFFSEMMLSPAQPVCFDDLTMYSVLVDIDGGASPYYLNGDLVSANFLIDSIASGDTYEVDITDSNGCTQTISGIYTCDCDNAAGTISGDDILTACEGDTIVIPYDNNALMSPDDIGVFIIYSSNDLFNVNNIIRIQDSPLFSSEGLDLDVDYFVVHAIGSTTLTGTIDLEDPCFQTSNVQWIRFTPYFIADAGDDQEVCGLEATLQGISNSLDYSWGLEDISQGTILDTPNNTTTSVLSTDYGTFGFILSTENEQCGDTDTVNISFIQELSYTLDSVVCSVDSFRVYFSISGGVAPYTVDGVLISNNSYVSSSFGLVDSYSFLIDDQSDCSNVEINGESTCDCISDAGTMEDATIVVCGDEEVFLDQYSNFDFATDDNDEVFLVIHNSATMELGDIVGVLPFDPFTSLNINSFSFEYGVTYYASVVVANQDYFEGGVEDVCISVAAGVPFRFDEPIILTSGDDQEVCGNITTLIGTAPDTNVIWKIDDLAPGFGISWDPSQFNAPLMAFTPGVYSFYLTPIDEDQCYITDTVYITFFDAPLEAEIDSLVTICNNSDFGSIIDLNDQIIDGFSEGSWSINGVEVDPIIDFDDEEPIELVYQYESTSEDCGSLIYNVSVTVKDCNCPTIDVNIMDASCFDSNDGTLEIILEDGQDISDYEIIINDDPTFDLTLENLNDGTYDIQITGSNLCTYSFDMVINEPSPVSVSLGEDMEVQVNDSITIEALTDLALSDLQSVTWSNLNGILANDALEYNTTLMMSDSIAIEIEDEAGCIGIDYIKIKVSREDFILPNVISVSSQNGNGNFGLLDITGVDIIKQLAIYDRWGSAIYIQENIQPDSELARWNGQMAGSFVSEGVYVYQMIIVVAGEEIQLVGDLTVLR